jgi:hypothetical protein
MNTKPNQHYLVSTILKPFNTPNDLPDLVVGKTYKCRFWDDSEDTFLLRAVWLDEKNNVLSSVRYSDGEEFSCPYPHLKSEVIY